MMITAGLIFFGIKIGAALFKSPDVAVATGCSSVALAKKATQHIDWGKFFDNGVEKVLTFSQDVGWTNIYNQARPYIVDGWAWLCEFFAKIWDRALSGELVFC